MTDEQKHKFALDFFENKCKEEYKQMYLNGDKQLQKVMETLLFASPEELNAITKILEDIQKEI